MKVLITGITGTLGQAVMKLALADGHEVVGVSRDEQKQRAIPSHPGLKLLLADVRDLEAMTRASVGCDVIFHFAALKCVDTLEHQPAEAYKTNVIGTQNILTAQEVNGVKRVVLSSTDKAAYSINAYGHSKAMAEKLVLQNPNNIVTRYGNVLASRGSVIPQFVKSLRSDGLVKITHPEMTRFFLRIEDAAAFVYKVARDDKGGLKIPTMKACKMTALAAAMADVIGLDKFGTQVIGIRPGEKIHECLMMAHEGVDIYSNTSVQFDHAELMDLIAPIVAAS